MHHIMIVFRKKNWICVTFFSLTNISYIDINTYKTTLILFLVLTGCTYLKTVKKPLPPIDNDIIQSYFPSGNIEYEAKYLNGKLDGYSRTWFENGKISSESKYSYGQPHGKWKKFHPDGSIMYEVHYEYGKKNGFEKWFYNNGQIKSEQNFVHGQIDGGITRWQLDGTLIY